MILSMFKPRAIVLSVLALLTLSGIGGAVYHYGWNRPGVKVSHKHKQLWTCSMHPQVLKDEPGLCPICQMQLVPIKEQGQGDEKAAAPGASGPATDGKGQAAAAPALQIRLETSVIQTMGVRTEVVRSLPIAKEIRGIAHIEFNEMNQAIVNSRVNGWVENLYARYTGQPVRRGQALAGIYSPQLVSTQEEYLQLFKRHQEAKGTPLEQDLTGLVAAAKKRLRYWNISSAQIANIEKTGKVERTLTLYSPYSGAIVEKHVVEGARVTEGMNLFKIIDLSTVWAFVHIPEKDIAFVREGMAAEMIVTQIPGKQFKGQVSFIFPYMDRQTRDLRIRVSFANPGFQLRPGMYATLILKSGLPGQHMVVPMSAVIRTGERALAFVYRGNGVFEPRAVEVGVAAAEDRLQILSGLKVGEAVVVSGQFLLDSETRIQEAVRKLRGSGPEVKSAPGGHQH